MIRKADINNKVVLTTFSCDEAFATQLRKPAISSATKKSSPTGVSKPLCL